MSYVYASRHILLNIKEFSCPSRRFTKGCFFACVLLPVFWGMTATVFAQGIERYSMAGQSAAEAAHNTNIENQPYNLQIGPVTLRADAGLTVSYNDNINLANTGNQAITGKQAIIGNQAITGDQSNTGMQADWIITPDVNIHALWQATELNTLTFDLGISYQQYLAHSAYDSIQIAPDSQTQFKIFIGDFVIHLHDAFSYQNNPTAIGQLSHVSQFHYFSNDGGVLVDWDLGTLILTLGYDHTNFLVVEQAFSYLDYQSDVVSSQIAYNYTRTIQVGINGSFGSTKYDQNVQNNSTQLAAGPFVAAQITENLSINARGGLALNTYSQGGSNGDSSNVDSFYFSAGFTHRINDALRHSLTIGREFLPGITSNYTDRIYANYTPSWHATTLFDISPQLWWESLQDSSASFQETSTRFGGSLTIAFALTQHATVSLGYNYVMKNSNQRSFDYYQDLITLGLKYQF